MGAPKLAVTVASQPGDRLLGHTMAQPPSCSETLPAPRESKKPAPTSQMTTQPTSAQETLTPRQCHHSYCHKDPLPPNPLQTGKFNNRGLTHILSYHLGHRTSRSSSQQPSTPILPQLLSSRHLKALTTSQCHRVLGASLLNHPQLHN